MKYFVFCLCVFFFSPMCAAKQTLVVWEKNYHSPFFKESLQNMVTLTDEEFGEVELVPSQKMEQGRAFAELVKGNIDVFIGGADTDRESLANAIYVPIDRGLLGFRVCLKHSQTPPFSNIHSVEQFQETNFTIGLGTHWPDTAVYRLNGFKVITSPVYDSLFAMLRNKRFSCFSRGVNEIEGEAGRFQENSIVTDDKLIFIYPNADFIFVSPKNAKLHKRLSIGMGRSIEDYSFFDLFNKYHQDKLLKYGIYERKLLVLNNNQLSNKALSAINRFGIASFVVPPLDAVNNQ